jgi:hypothetical protein
MWLDKYLYWKIQYIKVDNTVEELRSLTRVGRKEEQYSMLKAGGRGYCGITGLESEE